MSKQKHDPDECPYCQSRNICALTPFEAEHDQAWRSIECHDCGELWREVFKLVKLETENGKVLREYLEPGEVKARIRGILKQLKEFCEEEECEP